MDVISWTNLNLSCVALFNTIKSSSVNSVEGNDSFFSPIRPSHRVCDGSLEVWDRVFPMPGVEEMKHSRLDSSPCPDSATTDNDIDKTFLRQTVLVYAFLS